jgi:hypothetical protein
VAERRTSEPDAVRRVKWTMFWTDLGFLAYWVATALGLVSVSGGSIMSDWNWSFLGLDIVAIGTGLLSVAFSRRGVSSARALMIISLALTGAAGLMALNFWVLRGEYDLAWWLPNLWLFLFPVVALAVLARGGHLSSAEASRRAGAGRSRPGRDAGARMTGSGRSRAAHPS